jgi:hypothetical protein
VIQQLSLAAKFEAADDESRRLDKLETLLARATSKVAAQPPLIAPLLRLDGTVRYGALDLGPHSCARACCRS